MSEDLLFNTYDIFSVVRARTETVKKRVQGIPPNTLLGASEDVLIQALVEEFRMNVPVIKEDEIQWKKPLPKASLRPFPKP
jgi:hypothetical protein